MTVQELIDKLISIRLPDAEIRIEFANGKNRWKLDEIISDEDDTVILWSQTEV